MENSIRSNEIYLEKNGDRFIIVENQKIIGDGATILDAVAQAAAEHYIYGSASWLLEISHIIKDLWEVQGNSCVPPNFSLNDWAVIAQSKEYCNTEL